MKDFPFFKFYTSEWISGDITLESYQVQGVFINVCAFYWSKGGVVDELTMSRRFKGVGQAMGRLRLSGVVKVVDGWVHISFLDEQLSDKSEKSKINSENGKNGGRPKRIESESKPNGLFLETEHIFEEKAIRREEKRREENNIDSNESILQKPLFDNADTEQKKEKKVAVKKKENCDPLVTEAYPGLVKSWMEQYSEYIFGAVDGKKIKLIGAALLSYAKAREQSGSGPPPSSSTLIGGFEYLISAVKRDNLWYNGKSLSVWESKINDIIYESRHGKITNKKQSAADYINNL